MIELTSRQRKVLEKAAHALNPVVIVGAGGVTEGVSGMVAEQLKAHELIKVKFNEFKEDKKDLSDKLAADTDSTLVRIIGNIAIFYKESDDPEKKQYKKALAKA